MPDILTLSVFALLIFFMNIPFGYWRANVKKYKLQWYLAIHIPVLIIICGRMFSDVGWHWSTIVTSVLSFFLGQYLGGLLRRKKTDHYNNSGYKN
jgi:hypothetical protein